MPLCHRGILVPSIVVAPDTSSLLEITQGLCVGVWLIASLRQEVPDTPCARDNGPDHLSTISSSELSRLRVSPLLIEQSKKIRARGDVTSPDIRADEVVSGR